MFEHQKHTGNPYNRDLLWINNDVPAAMEKMGWEMAPKLMRHWFSIRPAFAFDKESKSFCVKADARTLPKERYNDSIITMNWAMRYMQVQRALNELVVRWPSILGIDNLNKKLIKVGDYKEKKLVLGYENKAIALDVNAQVNFVGLGSMFDTIDDFYGAIGKASLKVAVRGTTSLIDGKHAFVVEALGFYLKDTYDFLDETLLNISIPEPLGWWNKNGTMNKVEIGLYLSSYANGLFAQSIREAAGYSLLTNKDFREWQRTRRSGGDFIVYSDVLWTPPLAKDRVIFL